jgi:trimeric autotransporter adhesin
MKAIFQLLLVSALASTPLFAQPVVTSQPANQTVVWGGNATFSVTATDVGPLTYQWQMNGTNLPNNIITTVAGGNLFNNQQATNVILNGAMGTAVDSSGNLFIADSGNNVIRKVDTNGFATIVAGNGSGSFSGDGGPATNAGLFFPTAVIVDKIGNLLIADTVNYRVRKVDTNGIITTIAGNGLPYISFSQVGDGGAATNGTLYEPNSLALDAIGNLFIADSGNNRVAKVGTNGIISTVAGFPGFSGYSGDNFQATGARLNYPSGIALDFSNNLYIADTYNNRIRKVNGSGIISTVVGNGTAGYSGDGGAPAGAKINNPMGVTVDAERNLFVVDSGNNCIRKVGTNNIITTSAGNGVVGFSGDGGSATNANIAGPPNVAVDSIGNLFIPDRGNNRVRKVGTNGIISTVAGRALNDGDFATNATLNLAYGIAVDSVGSFYVADSGNNRIRKVDANGIIRTVAGNGTYAYSGDGGAATNASLRHPYGIALDAWGNLYIADYNNYRIRRVDTNGIISTIAGTGSFGFSGDAGSATNAKIAWVYGLAVDAAGNCFFPDAAYNRIRKIDTTGSISTVAGNGSYIFSGDGGMATNAAMLGPLSVALDSAGNLFIADTGNVRVRKVDTNGIISTVAGNGGHAYSGDGGAATNASLNSPVGLTVDSAGEIFVSDSYIAVVRKVAKNGIITTVAGNGVQGFGGDGGPGNSASFSNPRGLAASKPDEIYVADTGNNRIRKLSYVNYADQPVFTVANVTPASLGNNYSVIITSSSGSVTSSVVTLTLTLPPITTAFSPGSGQLDFTWGAVSNLTYQLQCTTNLATPDWTDIGSPITATNDSASTTETAGSDGQRFYRVRLVP